MGISEFSTAFLNTFSSGFLGSFSREQMPVVFYLTLLVQTATVTKQDEGSHGNPAMKTHLSPNVPWERYGPYRKQHRKPHLPMTCHINKHSPHSQKNQTQKGNLK